MKLLIAFNDSPASAAALSDLRKAGLPPDTAATVLTICTAFDEEAVAIEPHSGATILAGGEQPVIELERSLAIARIGEAQLAGLFPGWHVRAEARAAESPDAGILEELAMNGADLVLLGEESRSLVDRAFQGSVVQKVLAGSPCSVRIGRHGGVDGAGLPPRILAGIDGSAGSGAAIAAIADRIWPPGTVVRIVGVLGGYPAYADAMTTTPLPLIYEWSEQQRRQLADFAAEAEETLRASGLEVIVDIVKGIPSRTIPEIAAGWGADAIFVGALGHGLLDRLLLGSVSGSVAKNAGCTVEIVRPGEGK